MRYRAWVDAQATRGLAPDPNWKATVGAGGNDDDDDGGESDDDNRDPQPPLSPLREDNLSPAQLEAYAQAFTLNPKP